MVTTTTTTIMAIMPPVERLMEFFELSPEAPASEPDCAGGASPEPASP